MYATQIRDLRQKLGYTQTHLAEIASLDVKTVQRAESGHRISAETVLALSSALKTTPAALRGESEPAEGRGDLAVIRSGRSDDQIALIPEFQASVRDVPGLTHLVLTRQNPIIRLRDFPSGRAVIGLAGFVSCGAGYVIVKMCELKLWSPLGLLVFVLGSGILPFLLQFAPGPNKRRMLEEHERPINRAYAIGPNRICDLRIVDDKVTCQIYGIDPRIPIVRDTFRGFVTFEVPIAGGKFEAEDCPVNDDLDALLIRGVPKPEYREIPRDSQAVASAA